MVERSDPHGSQFFLGARLRLDPGHSSTVDLLKQALVKYKTRASSFMSNTSSNTQTVASNLGPLVGAPACPLC